jgi:hypothetical protein
LFSVIFRLERVHLRLGRDRIGRAVEREHAPFDVGLGALRDRVGRGDMEYDRALEVGPGACLFQREPATDAVADRALLRGVDDAGACWPRDERLVVALRRSDADLRSPRTPREVFISSSTVFASRIRPRTCRPSSDVITCQQPVGHIDRMVTDAEPVGLHEDGRALKLSRRRQTSMPSNFRPSNS